MDILLIEDEYNLRQSLQLILTQAGYTAIALRQGTDALKMLEIQKYNLIILSLHNSDQHAFDQIAKIRASFPSIPIMVLAANESTELEKAIQGNADVYLLKPIDPALILDHINGLLKGNL